MLWCPCSPTQTRCRGIEEVADLQLQSAEIEHNNECRMSVFFVYIKLDVNRLGMGPADGEEWALNWRGKLDVEYVV